jgi:hypothetical protein
MEYIEFEDFISQSTAYLRACNDKAERHFGIGGYARYEYDLHRREIWWGDVGVPKVRGKVTIVGSISTKSDTWLWSWGNPHFNEVDLGPILEVKKFGEQESITKLTESKWAAQEVDGWEMTSVSARLLEAQGAYKSPSDKGSLFLLFDQLEFIPEDEIGPYLPLKREAPSEDTTQPQSETLSSPMPPAFETADSPQVSAPPAQSGIMSPRRDRISFTWIRRVAIITLCVLAILNLRIPLRSEHPFSRILVPLVLWTLFIWKIVNGNRKWNLGIGIGLCVMILLQHYLWIRAVMGLDHAEATSKAETSYWSFLPYQVLLLIAATCCFRLGCRKAADP